MIKHTALALVLCAAASTAYAAGSDSSSFLRCGVIFGGRSLTYDSGDQDKERKVQRLNARQQTAQPEPLRLAPSAAAAGSENDPLAVATTPSDSRLPRNLTLATIGCAWR